MRRLAFLVLLGSCGSPPPAAPGNWIDCRPQGAAAFARTCSLETSADGRLLTIRKADGGFRRLRVIGDGIVAAADGAERTHLIVRPDGEIEVEIGGDRFRLPARIRAQ